MNVLAGRRIVLGVTGGIAAYKACEIVRELRKEGADVRVVLTAAGARFITPLTLQTLAKNPVVTDLFDLTAESAISHIELAQTADLLLVAPATANILGKVRGGIADDLLSTVAMAATAPILFAPAMNAEMYAKAAVRENIRVLAERGCHFVEPDAGELACGTVGPGRLAEPAKIVEMARIVLTGKLLAGRKVVVSAGPTEEALDPVRFLSNRSSGKMGYAMARAARRMGAQVTLVAGPTALPAPFFVEVVPAATAEGMGEAVFRAAAEADIVVMAAAVADFRAKAAAETKIKKEGFSYRIDLSPTVDILEALGKAKGRKLLVGFAAETEGLDRNAREKMQRKNLDAIVANDVSRPDIGFGADENEVRVLFREGEAVHVPRAPKDEVADAVWRALYGNVLSR